VTRDKRNGRKNDYLVKLKAGTGMSKPLHGNKGAVLSFSPAAFGDSCWGTAGEMRRELED
jgi:hypothetical protein